MAKSAIQLHKIVLRNGRLVLFFVGPRRNVSRVAQRSVAAATRHSFCSLGDNRGNRTMGTRRRLDSFEQRTTGRIAVRRVSVR